VESKNFADSLGILAPAKNLDDETVEIIAEGKEKDLRKLLEWCHRGPKMAKVERVDAVWDKFSGILLLLI